MGFWSCCSTMALLTPTCVTNGDTELGVLGTRYTTSQLFRTLFFNSKISTDVVTLASGVELDIVKTTIAIGGRKMSAQTEVRTAIQVRWPYTRSYWSADLECPGSSDRSLQCAYYGALIATFKGSVVTCKSGCDTIMTNLCCAACI